jgi:S-DNA-T family DNA segregation ATPase FtsK/SpoIIIE
MPHLLIAGTTGSGKSVCINSILLSILYRAKPSEVKLILIDPKVVELNTYNAIPHLFCPVVADPEGAAAALRHAVITMEERFGIFAQNGADDLESYNAKMKKEYRHDEMMPQIVIVIDELADLMLVARDKVEGSISRLAGKARAAGIHLIVATQQPLVKVVTSLIKANIPSRIAFQVSSVMNSRVILDERGAEHLKGKGDMLFLTSSKTIRVQGTFTEKQEVSRVVEFVKKQMKPEYSVDLMAKVDAAIQEVADMPGEEEDEFFLDAVEFISGSKNKQVSVSMLQRRFRIGYNRAARLVDMMEERGIVAASDGTNKPRRLIMSEAQLKTFLESAGQASWIDEDIPDENNDDVVVSLDALEALDFDEPDEIDGEYETDD